MGSYFGRSAAQAALEAGGAVFEKTEVMPAVGEEGQEIGQFEATFRVTLYDGTSTASAQKFMDMGYRQIHRVSNL